MTTNYRQCELAKPTSTGELRQTSWLPEQFAVKGSAVKLKGKNGWNDGWQVRVVGSVSLPENGWHDYRKLIARTITLD